MSWAWLSEMEEEEACVEPGIIQTTRQQQKHSNIVLVATELCHPISVTNEAIVPWASFEEIRASADWHQEGGLEGEW